MVTVTQATLENQLPLFIKSLLTANLTDPRTSRTNPFIFKYPPESENDEYPYIIIETGSSSGIFPSDGTLYIPREIELNIRIVTKGKDAIKTRDQLTDSISQVMQDPILTDVDGKSMRSNCINLRSVISDHTDIFKQDGNVIRVNEITYTLVYYGA